MPFEEQLDHKKLRGFAPSTMVGCTTFSALLQRRELIKHQQLGIKQEPKREQNAKSTVKILKEIPKPEKEISLLKQIEWEINSLRN